MQRYVDAHVSETVERCNLRRRVQMPGESFDDFLISLRELAKTCRFCSETCTQKSICEGLSDGDTIEDLLQVSDLTLTAAITKCQSREAAQKHRTDITAQGDVVAVLRKPQAPYQTPSSPCPGCGANRHRGGRMQCLRSAHCVKRLGTLQEYVEASVRPIRQHPRVKSLLMLSASNHHKVTTSSCTI